MQIAVSRKGNVDIVQAQGRLDAATASGLDQRLASMIDAGSRRVALDLSGIEYVSSAGLRVFLSAAKRLQQVQGKLSLAAPTPQVRQLFEMAGLAGVLPVFDTVEAASNEA